jgi:hypothetical protein
MQSPVFIHERKVLMIRVDREGAIPNEVRQLRAADKDSIRFCLDG